MVEIEATPPGGAPEPIVRRTTANRRTLEFRSPRFESD